LPTIRARKISRWAIRCAPSLAKTARLLKDASALARAPGPAAWDRWTRLPCRFKSAHRPERFRRGAELRRGAARAGPVGRKYLHGPSRAPRRTQFAIGCSLLNPFSRFRVNETFRLKKKKTNFRRLNYRRAGSGFWTFALAGRLDESGPAVCHRYRAGKLFRAANLLLSTAKATVGRNALPR